MLENRGARYVAWDRGGANDHIFPYECDPSFAANYQDEDYEVAALPLIFAQLSLSVTVRLNTGRAGVESGSTQK